MVDTDKHAPRLRAGDQITAAEFMRRWENEPAIKNAELIKGTVYVKPMVSIHHGEMQGLAGMLLSAYHAFTPGTGAAHNATTFMLDDVPQPDLHLRLLPECGGHSRVEGDYLHGSPELIIEICPTGATYDLHEKLELYQDAMIQEYVAVLLHENEIIWHRLVNGVFQTVNPEADHIFRSQVFPGLWLNGPALLARQSDRVLATLHEGMASAEHRAFVEKLADASGRGGK